MFFSPFELRDSELTDYMPVFLPVVVKPAAKEDTMVSMYYVTDTVLADDDEVRELSFDKSQRLIVDAPNNQYGLANNVEAGAITKPCLALIPALVGRKGDHYAGLDVFTDWIETSDYYYDYSSFRPEYTKYEGFEEGAMIIYFYDVIPDQKNKKKPCRFEFHRFMDEEQWRAAMDFVTDETYRNSRKSRAMKMLEDKLKELRHEQT